VPALQIREKIRERKKEWLGNLKQFYDGRAFGTSIGKTDKSFAVQHDTTGQIKTVARAFHLNMS
jgi:hypothetical protein